MLKNRVFRLALPLLFLGASLVPLPALDPKLGLNEYSAEYYSAENGLPQSSVLAMTQTRDGFLWLGTYEGLARFDGQTFTVFDKGNTPAMDSNGIKSLLEDREGRLWVGTTAGLLRQSAAGFERFDERHGLKSNSILCLLQDHAGTLWVGTSGGLHRWQGERFRPITTAQGLSSDYVSALVEDGAGGLWVGTGQGLNRLRAGRIETFQAGSGLTSSDIRTLYRDPQGTLWIGTSGGGLVTWRDGRFTPVDLQGASGDIRAIYRDRRGVMWIGTNQEPLLRIHDGQVTVMHQRLGGLTSGRAILEDREGSLWVGTRDGLLQLKDDKFIIYNSRNGLPVDPVRAVFEDRRGALWVGTVGGGLVRFFEGRWLAFGSGQGLASEHVWSIAQSSDGALWVGTYGGGLFRLADPAATSGFRRVPGLASDIIRSLLADSQGRVWAGTNGGGLDCIDRRGRVTNYTTADGLPDNFVYSLAEDRRGRIWAGVFNGGLAVLEGKRFRSVGDESLRDQPVWAIHVDAAGDIWAGTDHAGLHWVHDGRVVRFTSRDGMYSDQAFQVIEDAGGRVWLNGNRGIYHVARKDLAAFAAGRLRRIPCVAYGKAEGIKVTESSGPASPAGCIDRRGRLWFPTIRGLAMFDPGRQRVNPVEPPVVVERAVINGREWPVAARALVPPGRGNIEIAYTAVSFLRVDRMRFAYRLEGYDAEWVDAGQRRAAYYTNLPPRQYTFRVRACNGDGVWSRRAAAFTFALRPYFSQTVLFRWLVAVVALLLIAGVFFFFLHRARVRQRQLERIVDERTQQLQRLARFDGLTDLANHRTFYEVFQREWAVAGRERKPLSVITADIDYFKPYNDTFGHQEGDQCLRRVAAAIRAQAKRPADLAARTGGEEFFLLLPGTDSAGAKAIAENVRAAVAALAIPHPASLVSSIVTVSLGVATMIPPASTEANEFIARADQALYEAKRGGRNRICGD
jgi:diguanylate cyclase (GGDEF)-like protein